MLLLHAERPPKSARARRKLGLAIAGGGPIGGMWELGALCALEDGIEGLDLTALDVYVGVSSGAFIAAGLANGIAGAEMARIFLTGDSLDDEFHPQDFVRPAWAEYFRRAAALPRVALEGFAQFVRNPFAAHLSETLARMCSVLPTGLFDNNAVESFLRRVLEKSGRSNDFRKLARKLYVIAVELDSGRPVRFGAHGLDDVPISRAVEASAALPGLYPPVKIGDAHYLDGALARTLHASAALEEGATLVFGVNPLVPFAADATRTQAAHERLIDVGLPAVLAQTFRTLMTSRMQIGLGKYARDYPHADMLVAEPHADDAELFFANMFSYANRVRVAELAFRSTRADLVQHADEIEPLLARHGLSLHRERLAARRTLRDALDRPARVGPVAPLAQALDRLDDALRTRGRTRKPRAVASNHGRR